MAEKKAKKTWVIGHKNPDTDSICSAIAYARLKETITGDPYIPKRAGHINQETSFVLKTFGVMAMSPILMRPPDCKESIPGRPHQYR